MTTATNTELVTPHTAGPWRVATFRNPQEICARWSIETVAETHELGPAVIVDGQLDDCPESLANARLIANAPELLEALKAAEMFVNKVSIFVHTRERINERAGAAWCVEERQKIAAAIAKAEGRE
jgi:hypothetical protein